MNLTIDPEELIAVGNTIVSQSESFQGYLNKIVSLNEQLKAAWQGQDAAAYAQTVSDQATSMTKLGQTINAAGNHLVTTGTNYKRVEEENASAAR